MISKVVLSSDDEDILEIGKCYTDIISLARPKNISGAEAPAITYVNHVLETLSEKFDYSVIIQPSSPFTLPEDIDGNIQLLIDCPIADSAVSVMKLDHAIHPIKLKIKKGNLLLPYIEAEKGRMASHELPEIYLRNGSVYVSRIETIKKGKIIGEYCLGFVMPRKRSLDINEQIDLDFAEYMISKYGM